MLLLNGCSSLSLFSSLHFYLSKSHSLALYFLPFYLSQFSSFSKSLSSSSFSSSFDAHLSLSHTFCCTSISLLSHLDKFVSFSWMSLRIVRWASANWNLTLSFSAFKSTNNFDNNNIDNNNINISNNSIENYIDNNNNNISSNKTPATPTATATTTSTLTSTTTPSSSFPSQIEKFNLLIFLASPSTFLEAAIKKKWLALRIASDGPFLSN